MIQQYGSVIPDFSNVKPPFPVNAGTLLFLPYPPSVNRLFASVSSSHGGQIRVKTKLYRDWIKEAGIQVMAQRKNVTQHSGNIEVTYIATPPKDNRKRDLANLEKSLSDLLVSCNIIKDDSLIQSIKLKWDRSHPEVGVKVFINDWSEA